MINLAPIVLFVYNRVRHTKKTIEALLKNELACESDLFIYSDASKSEDDLHLVQEVRRFIKTVGGFKNITIIERETNLGLANSIVDGVTKIVNEYGKIIVLEDDLITAPVFLKYMNEALIKYKEEENVYSITGYSFTDEVKNIDSTYFLSMTSSWGWATWSDKWSIFERDAESFCLFINNKSNHNKFNFDNSYDYVSLAKAQLGNKLNSWAIYWYFCIYQNNGLTLYPHKSLISNIGFDGSGVHCGSSAEGINTLGEFMPELTDAIEEKEESRNIVRKKLESDKKSLFYRIIIKLISIFK